jgi:hypothetical protein
MLFVHTAASSGTVMSMHYCMGSLASMQIGHEEELECAKCGMKNSGCCHDDVKVLKIDNAQFVVTSTDRLQDYDHIFLQPVSFSPSNFTFVSKNFFTLTPKYFNEGPPIFILNCNFRI